MDVGIQMIFQKFGYGDDMSDSRIYDEEVALGVLADELGKSVRKEHGQEIMSREAMCSRCPCVSVMKTIDLLDRNDVTSLGRFDLTGYRRVSFQ